MEDMTERELHDYVAEHAWRFRRGKRERPAHTVVLALSGPKHPEYDGITLMEWNASAWLCDHADRRADSITWTWYFKDYFIAYFDDGALAMEYKLRWTGVYE